MEKTTDPKADNGQSVSFGSSEKSKDPNKPASWIECRYEVKIDNVIQKLEAVTVNTFVASDTFGTGKLLWNVEIVKRNKKPTLDPPTEEKSFEDETYIGVFLKAAKVSEIPGGIRAKFHFCYGLEGSAKLWSCLLGRRPFPKANVISLFTNQGRLGWENFWTMSELKSLINGNPTGTLKLSAVILVENSHFIAYDLANYVHSSRVTNHVACDSSNRGRQQPLFIEIRTRFNSSTDGVNEPSDDFADNISAALYMRALHDAASTDKTTATDTTDMQQVQADKMDVVAPIAALSAPLPPQYESFYVWKSLLVQASPVFKAMFEDSDTIEFRSGIVTVEDFPREVIGAFTGYISRGPVAVEEAEHDLLTALVKMADKYCVKDLFNLGIARMLQSIHVENVAEYYATAHLLDIIDVKYACIAAIKQKWIAEAGKDEFWSKDFGRFGVKVMGAAFADFVKLA